MSRPASSSGVSGFTDAIVGTLERMRNVGRISNSDATTTATAVMTVNVTGNRSQVRCQPSRTKRVQAPAGTGAFVVPWAGSPAYSFVSRGAWITGKSYVAGRRRHVIRML